jgi:hypothetical protein
MAVQYSVIWKSPMEALVTWSCRGFVNSRSSPQYKRSGEFILQDIPRVILVKGCPQAHDMGLKLHEYRQQGLWQPESALQQRNGYWLAGGKHICGQRAGKWEGTWWRWTRYGELLLHSFKGDLHSCVPVPCFFSVLTNQLKDYTENRHQICRWLKVRLTK